MSEKHIVTAASCLRSARLFNYASIISISISTLLLVVALNINTKMSFLPFVLSVPPIMLWLAGSIFVYAAIAHHPDPRVVHYNRWAGYRYYAMVGTMVVAGQPLYGIFEDGRGMLLVWGLMALGIVPLGLRDIVRAGREDWKDIEVETGAH